MRGSNAADLPVFFGNFFGEGRSVVVRSEGVGKARRVRSESVGKAVRVSSEGVEGTGW